MKAKFSLIAIILILVVPVLLYTVFKTPYNNGALEAANGKPIVIEFSSPLCAECQKLKKVMDKVEPDYSRKITFQKINTGTMDAQVMEQVKKYEVRVVPTTIFINKKGEIIAKKEGSMPKEILKAYFDELLK